MLTDPQWAMLEPLVEQCRPKGKTPAAGSASDTGCRSLAL
jgi:hypothetical protein